jgi:hypothetical protein
MPLLSRVDVCVELTKRGYPIKPATLAYKASMGGGPPMQKFGKRVMYDFDATLAWAKSQVKHVMSRPNLSPPK